MTRLKVYILAVLSAGWLIPLWASVGAFLNYVDLTVRPEIVGTGFKTSFPFLQASRFFFAVAAIWLACVIVAWSVFLIKALAATARVAENKGVSHNY